MLWKYKRLFLGIAIALLLGSAFSVSAAESNEPREPQVFTDSVVYVNPLYADLIQSIDVDGADGSGYRPFALNSFQTREDAAAYMNSRLIAREESITFQYYTSNSSILEELRSVWNMALYVNADTDPRSGDYLKFNYGRYKMTVSYYYDSEADKYCCTPAYEVSYLGITAEQEEAVDEGITAALRELDLSDKADYDKIEAIYNYITENVTYDYDNLNDSFYLRKHSTYAAVIDKTAVCQGFATMFYRMCREAGLDVRIISGLGNGGSHAWNIVRIDNEYYNVDVKWDASARRAQQPYAYFLKSMEDFPGHMRDEEYTTSEFYSDYPMAAVSYNAGAADEGGDGDDDGSSDMPAVLTPGVVSYITVDKGSVENCLRIAWNSAEHADGYELQARMGSGSYETIANLEGSDSVTYAHKSLSTGNNYYYRVRAYRFSDNDDKIYGGFSPVKGGHVAVAPPSFAVVGCFGGREVTFRSDSSDVKIYYSQTGSNITVKDSWVNNGNKVIFSGYYGTIYAKAYDTKSGAWSPVSRLILKIPAVNTPVVTMNDQYAVVKCTTPNSYLVYTLDGTDPSPTHGVRIWSTQGKIYVPTGKRLKVMAIRSCFGNSEIVQN